MWELHGCDEGWQEGAVVSPVAEQPWADEGSIFTGGVVVVSSCMNVLSRDWP